MKVTPVYGEWSGGKFTTTRMHEYFADGERWLVPRGFSCDLATLVPCDRYDHAALLHDWICRVLRLVPRARADRIFRLVLEQDGIGWRERWVAWAAVRFGAQVGIGRAKGR